MPWKAVSSRKMKVLAVQEKGVKSASDVSARCTQGNN
jgi:hypothetical protein